MIRFDTEPRDRRIFVLPEPDPNPPRVRAVPPTVRLPGDGGPHWRKAPLAQDRPVLVLDAQPVNDRPPAPVLPPPAPIVAPVPTGYAPRRIGTFPRRALPDPALAPPTERELILGTLRKRHGGWFNACELARETGVDELRACHLLERLWRAGLVQRHHRAFCPRHEREYRLRETVAVQA